MSARMICSRDRILVSWKSVAMQFVVSVAALDVWDDLLLKESWEVGVGFLDGYHCRCGAETVYQVRAAISCGSQEPTKQGSSERKLGKTCRFFRLFECSCKDDAVPLPPTSSIQRTCFW